MTQVITVAKDGSLLGLDHKRKGLDLAKLGKAEKRRVSEIVWNVDQQRWMVNLLTSKGNGEIATLETARLAGALTKIPDCRLTCSLGKDGEFLFVDYEDAVAAEVAILQGLQRRGLFHG